jgi:myo-inositol-1-phosphate synthase
MTRKIRVALIGVGNSASVFVQGLICCRGKGKVIGLWHPDLGGYSGDDVEVVEAFDINPAKIGLDISEAMFVKPNAGRKYADVGKLGVQVRRGFLLDRLPEKVSKLIGVEGIIDGGDVSAVLKNSRVDAVLNLIPSGLDKTSQYYAEAALQAGCSLINCTPSLIAGDPDLVSAFEDKKLLVVGDDMMSQFGGTVFHKGILDFMDGRGVRAVRSYQLDVGGGAETLNTVDEKNKAVKRDIKTSSISIEVPYDMEIVAGTTEYVDYMGNDRTSYYLVSGKGFLGSPIRMDIYLRSSDGPNAANTLLDIVRSAQISREKGRYGAPNEICAYGFKRPPTPIKLDEAYQRFSETYLQ